MKTAEPYSLAARIRSQIAGTWGKVPSAEWRITSDLHEQFGIPDSGFDLVPPTIMASRATLTAANPSGAGYLDDPNVVGTYVHQLLPQMNLGRLGAQGVAMARTSTLIPYGATALVPTWLSNELTATDAVAPAFGGKIATRKTILTSTTVSRQLLLQSNIDEILPMELSRAAAAAIDLAGIQGLGADGVPLGLLSNPDVPTASGATLTYEMLVALMEAVANANAVTDPASLGFLTSPAVAALLKARYFSAANLPIWKGSVPAGTIDEQPAFTSTNVPAASLIHGDFSNLLIAGWSDGLSIAVDPFTFFQSGITTVRLCISVDFVLPNPAGFSTLTGIT